MQMRLKKGQVIMEAGVLLCVIISALMIMQFYIKRSYQGRIKDEADQIGQQYSPGHTTSMVRTDVRTISSSATGGRILLRDGTTYKDVTDGMTVTISDSSQSVNKDASVEPFKNDNK